MPTLLRIGETGVNLDLVIEWIVSPEPNNSISLCLLFAVPEWPHDEHPAAHLEPFSLVFLVTKPGHCSPISSAPVSMWSRHTADIHQSSCNC